MAVNCVSIEKVEDGYIFQVNASFASRHSLWFEKQVADTPNG